jgi:3-hydroxyisobutyrate dehydrogenase
MRVGILGAGAMGARIARNLAQRGHDIAIYNRTLAHTSALAAEGMHIVPTPRAAATGADAVIALVRDDAASRFVWLDPEIGALAALGTRSLAIESSTVSPRWVQQLAVATGANEAAFVCAPVVGSRPQAESRQLVSFAGGHLDAAERARPLLQDAGCTVHFAPSAHLACVAKLVVNDLFGIQVAALAEIVMLLRRMDVDPNAILALLEKTSALSPAARGAVGLMLRREHAPLYPIELVAKDYGYILKMATAAGADLPLSSSAGALYAQAASTALRDSNITVVLEHIGSEAHSTASI